MEDVESSIPARFEKIARLHPHRIAVKSALRELSYSELNTAANRIANNLRAGWGEIAEPVGLLCPKSVGFVVGMLGIQKAGKIAVPVDPAFPSARLATLFQDMHAHVVVCEEETVALAKRFAGELESLNIDECHGVENFENPPAMNPPDSIACIFYTSGSTGLPKGVMETHRNLLYLAMRETNDFHICHEDKLTLVASSGRDVFRALLTGAAIHPVDMRQQGFGALVRLLREQGITILNCVTSVFRNTLRSLSSGEQFPSLRLIKLTGEPLYKNDFELYRRHFSDACVLVNSYGPNEAGPSTRFLMDKASVIESSMVPVGYAVPGKEIILVDEAGTPVKLGDPGEIVVRSRYLSAGYWNKAEQTRDAFPGDLSNPQVRRYACGDIGVLRADGCLLYWGRKDTHVKIRGNKVDLAAVEVALLNFETLKEAAVAVLDDGSGDPRLVAYLVAKMAPPPNVNLLSDNLKQTLPGFMIPLAFVFLDKLPVTGIGKVDRRALPIPEVTRPQLDVTYVAPRDEIESQLSLIWKEVLGLIELGVHDNFFHLGGHSLKAMQVVARVLEVFQLDLPVKALFDAPTIAAMAATIAQYQSNPACDERLEHMLSEIEAMTEEEARKRLAGRKRDSEES